MDNEEKITRSKRAAVILDDPLIKEALQLLGDHYTKLWQESTAAESDIRQRAWDAYKVSVMFKQHFHKVLRDGQMALKDVQLAEERRKGIGRFLAA